MIHIDGPVPLDKKKLQDFGFYKAYPIEHNGRTVQGRVIGTSTKYKIIPEEEVQYLASIHCTAKEIAGFYDVKEEQIRDTFGDIMRRERAVTRQRLRKAQLDLALSGDKTMLIWLGKQMLGQTENPTNSDADHKVLPWVDNSNTNGDPDETKSN